MMTGEQRRTVRAVVRLAVEYLRDAPPTDYAPGVTLHEAVAGILLDLPDDLDRDPLLGSRLAVLLAEELAR
jgi:hypothetical protein